jgi:hypothetical protein
MLFLFTLGGGEFANDARLAIVAGPALLFEVAHQFRAEKIRKFDVKKKKYHAQRITTTGRLPTVLGIP